LNKAYNKCVQIFDSIQRWISIRQGGPKTNDD